MDAGTPSTGGLPQRLAAILAADIAGYTRLMELDETGVVEAWRRARAEAIDPTVARHAGRIVKLTGDGFLAEFPTAEAAVRAALELQERLETMFADQPAERRIAFRIGVNAGDIWVDGEDIYGAGVNVAARLEGLAPPGGICISDSVHDFVKHKVAARFADLGLRRVKNVAQPVRVWRVTSTAAAPAEPHRSPHARLARPLAWSAAAALAVALAFALYRAGDQPAPTTGTPPARSIAVLPFTDERADDAYFADGLAEELLHLLAQIPELRVVARTSAFVFRNQASDVREIGRALNVRTVVEGTVRRDRDRVRIGAQLVDTSTGYQIWSQVYEARIDDLFAVQADVAQRIAGALEVVLAPETVRALGAFAPTGRPDLYQEYLRARHLFWQRSHAQVLRSTELLEEVVREDPGFARAWSTLAAAYYILGSIPGEDYERLAALAQRAAEEASRLDPRLAEPYAVLGMIHRNRYEWAESDAAFERAITLEPGDPTARLWYGIGLCGVGHCERGLPHLRAAAERDPLSAFVQSWLSSAHWIVGDVDGAARAGRQAANLGVPVWSGFYVAMTRGEHERAVEVWEAVWREENVDPAFVRPLVQAMLDPSLVEAAVQAVRDAPERLDPSRGDSSITHRLTVYVLLAQPQDALRELRWIAEHAPGRRTPVMTMLWDSYAAAVRREPGFIELMEEIGLIDHWRRIGWPAACRPEDARVACR